jgi:Tfp pilus assembly protein PilX
MNSLRTVISSRERGAALIIVLAFVVLLVGLVVAYFSRTVTDRQVSHSSFNQSKADQLAASATENIIGDLRQEIVNGSTATTVNGVTVYNPTAAANIIPQRSGNPSGLPDPVPNLVRRSWTNDTNLSVRSRASAVNSTTDVSSNGRYVTSTRWNSHYLVPKKNTTDDSIPVDVFSAATPDWVFVTNQGATVITSPNNSVIGRYSYAIYDEGGLLDANVAGYPSNTSAAQYGPKGVSAFADLTQITGMLQSGIDAIVGWRNYFSAGPSGTFPNFNFNTAAATNYVNSVLSNTNGFTTVPVPNPPPTSRTDQQFPTRHSLIQLRTSIGSAAFPTTALQYLTAFSRELNAPSWTPTLDATDMGAPNNGVGNIYAYKTNADSGTAVNRNLLNVRVANSFTRADGGTASVGDPLVQRRFPLTRLTGLGPSGPLTTVNSTIVNGVSAPASATTVQRDFGLLWNSANNRWDYVGHTGSTVQTAIETLGQVAAENPGREPNFFELLKAVILSGSVGLGSGSANTFVSAETKYYSTPLSSDYQIMQIGANIIDQWDSNNVPTFINFYDTTGNYELAGTENLPYLNKLVFKPAWIKVNPGNKDQFAAWLLLSLWNPHQNAPGTGQVRIAMPTTTQSMTATLTDSGIPSSITTTTPVVGSLNQYMTVDASAFGASPSAPTAVVNTGTGSNITQSPDNYWGFHFLFATNAGVTPGNSLTAYPDFGASGCNFEMQVQVSTSPVVWKAYQRWKGCGPLHPLICQSPPSWTATTLQDPEFVTLDPRTLRFGAWGNAGKQSTVAADYTDGTQGTLDWPAPRFERITALPPQGTLFSSSASTDLYKYANNVDGTVHYTDLDGVQRLGDFIAGATTAMLPTDSADRPLILSGAYPSPTLSAYANGGFQSVAQLGETFRDQPWKTLNFTTASPNATVKSADAGLLDVFTLHESSMEAGKTSLNTRQTPVLTALLSQATKRLTGANAISPTERDNIVIALQNLTTAQPMLNKAELVTRLAANSSVTGLGNKEARECVMRAFSDACQTRTWNLMIDVIAQSGRYPPNASTLAGFLVEGEQHYWVHVAIDRFTGQVIDKQIEVVKE